MGTIKALIELVFGLALFVNALLFLPQIICIIREKSAKGVSLITFLGFLLIQLAVILHALISSDYLLLFGYLLSVVTCGSVVVLILRYRKLPASSTSSTQNVELLEERIEFLENLIASMPGHVYWLDKNNICLGCNDNQARSAGLSSRHDIVGMRNKDLPWSKNNQYLADEIERANRTVMDTGMPSVFEEPSQLLDGSMRMYLSSKVPLKNRQQQVIGLLGISFDITEAKKEIEERLKFLDDVIAVMPGNVYFLDRNGVYLGCNDNQAKLIGLASRKDIVGKRNIDLPGFLISEILDPINQEVMKSGETMVIEEPAKLPDGTMATFLSSKVPIKNSEQQVIGMVGISVDVTELKAAKEKAEAANDAKEVFLRNMRHDLRTPFSGILTLSEFLAAQEVDPEKKQHLQCITESAQVLLEYMNTVLEQARQGSDASAVVNEALNLEKLIKEAMLTIAPMASSKQLPLTVNYPNTIPKKLIGDASRLQRIIMNLLGNAVKFTHEGEISVDVSLVRQSGSQVILAISVKDTGIGIPIEKYDEIFEKFTRLEAAYKGNYSGMGLGLHDVRQLCQELNGEVTVTGNGKQGTIFTCMLPFTIGIESQNTSSAVLQPAKSAVKFSTLTVLLVEDQPIAAYAAAEVMRFHHYEVDIATTGQAALRQFAAKKYDVLLLDIGLPDIDGLILAQQFKEMALADQQAMPPLVALTAHENNQEKDLRIFDKVLSKPFSLAALEELAQFIASFRDMP